MESHTDRAGAEEAARQGKGTMQWDDDVFSVETDSNPDHYRMNHLCDPNVISSQHTKNEGNTGSKIFFKLVLIDLAKSKNTFQCSNPYIIVKWYDSAYFTFGSHLR